MGEEGGGGSLLQSLALSIHSRERLIQVGEVMRADRTQSCAQLLEALQLLQLWLESHWNADFTPFKVTVAVHRIMTLKCVLSS